MTWETIPLRGGSVTVSWRLPGGKGAGRQLCITLSSGLCSAIGLRPDRRVVVQRDRMAGKLRLVPVDGEQEGARCPRWRRTRNADVAQIWVPLKDVALEQDKPAQLVLCETGEGEMVLKLPHWACPLVKVETGRAA